MLDHLYREIAEYIKANLGIYILIVIVFVVGIAAGSLAARTLDEAHSIDLAEYFSSFIYTLQQDYRPDQHLLLRQSVQQNMQFAVLVWLSGVLVCGFPLILLLVLVRGFSAGFTVAFLVKRYALRGLLFSLAAILPHNLLIIPALVIIAAAGFSLSVARLRHYLHKRTLPPLSEHLWGYTSLTGVIAILLCLGSLIEAYITPVFIRLILPMM